MLKKISAALLAVSILAVPALAAGGHKTVAAGPAQARSSQITTGIATSTTGKPHRHKVARHHHRVKVRSFAHRHHNKVSRLHAKTRLGIAKTSHFRKAGHTVSFKRVTPATRRG